MEKFVKEVLMVIAYIVLSCVEIEITDKIMMAVLPCFIGFRAALRITVVAKFAHCTKIGINIIKKMIKISEEYLLDDKSYE